MAPTAPPTWQLPPGVSRGLWDYAQAPDIANDYDAYFAHNSLFDFDEQLLLSTFQPLGRVADFGCGTGRALLPLVARGHRGLAIDLSRHMLEMVAGKAAERELDVDCVQANLVELGGIADRSVDHAMCMFSTLGMIRGRANRRHFLAHARRILRADGALVLHVHNFWYNLFDPGGPWWVVRSLVGSAWRRDREAGDRFFSYRGIPNMYLHVFRRGELLADLRHAGFDVERWIPLDTARRHPLSRPWLFGRIRANGWIAVCR